MIKKFNKYYISTLTFLGAFIVGLITIVFQIYDRYNLHYNESINIKPLFIVSSFHKNIKYTLNKIDENKFLKNEFIKITNYGNAKSIKNEIYYYPLVENTNNNKCYGKDAFTIIMSKKIAKIDVEQSVSYTNRFILTKIMDILENEISFIKKNNRIMTIIDSCVSNDNLVLKSEDKRGNIHMQVYSTLYKYTVYKNTIEVTVMFNEIKGESNELYDEHLKFFNNLAPLPRIQAGIR